MPNSGTNRCRRNPGHAEPDSALFSCDVRGIGESQPDTCGAETFLKPYGSDYFYAIHSIMLDRPYAGQRTHDVLRCSTGCKRKATRKYTLWEKAGARFRPFSPL